ncbi:hypothetical protein [Streptomyces sp. NK15101]|uniref:hypothetical protein n=1 Tax=Streptomyces sp. NK15101 TaxID=2873261 RepID=UPI001CED113B|nr:hypothetical protein [Streptomyces sp. NK15101]
MSAHQLPATLLLGAFAATAAVAWAGAGRRRGAPTIAGSLLLLQGALHLLFSTTGQHAQGMHHAMPGTDGAPAMAGMHTMPAMQALPGMDAMPGTDTMPGMDALSAMDTMATATTTPMTSASGAGMLAVHLLAALLCGLWLARGEAAFFTLARAALAYAFTPLRLLRALVPVTAAPRRPVRRARREALRPHAVVLAHALSRRGPPRLSAPRATALGAHV